MRIACRDRSTGTSGYLLLEVILAMLFISVALVGLIDGFTSAVGAQVSNNNHGMALLLLEEKINDLESSGFFSQGLQDGICPGHESFKWETATAKTDVPSLYRVEVTVSWPSGSEKVVV